MLLFEQVLIKLSLLDTIYVLSPFVKKTAFKRQQYISKTICWKLVFTLMRHSLIYKLSLPVQS